MAMATKPEKKANGRPSKYSKVMAATICNGIAEGKSLSDVCKQTGMPHRDTVYTWMREQPEFSDMYARARARKGQIYLPTRSLILLMMAAMTHTKMVTARK